MTFCIYELYIIFQLGENMDATHTKQILEEVSLDKFLEGNCCQLRNSINDKVIYGKINVLDAVYGKYNIFLDGINFFKYADINELINDGWVVD